MQRLIRFIHNNLRAVYISISTRIQILYENYLSALNMKHPTRSFIVN